MNIAHIPRYPVTIAGETTHIGTANELAIALDVLQGQHDRAILEQLRAHLAAIVGGSAGFTNVMRSLEPANQIFLITAVGDQLAGVLESARVLRDLLAALATESVEQQLLATLGPSGLRALIITPWELAQVLEWVYGQTDRQVIALLGADYIRRMIRNGDQLGLVLTALDEAGQLDLIENIGWAQVVQIVSDGRDLAFLMRALPAVLSAQLLTHYSREQLLSLIGNSRDWAYLYERLEPAEVEIVLNTLGVK